MIDGGSVFGMRVQVAASPEEWARYVEVARDAGGVEADEATRTDYDIVIDAPHGIVLVNPNKAQEILARIRSAAREVDPNLYRTRDR